jgi:hypothetical protein
MVEQLGIQALSEFFNILQRRRIRTATANPIQALKEEEFAQTKTARE